MTPIQHNDIYFEAKTGLDTIEQWLKDNNIEYKPFSKILITEAKKTVCFPLKRKGHIGVLGFFIPNPEDFTAAKLRWE